MQDGHFRSLHSDSIEGDRKWTLELAVEVGLLAARGAEHQVQVVQPGVAAQMRAKIQSGYFPHRHFQLLEVWHRPKSPNLKKANWIYL